MTIYHIEFAKAGVGLSGGEVCMLELIKYYKSRGHKNVLLTTDNGKETYTKQVSQDKLLEYRTISAYSTEKRYGVLTSYVSRTFFAIKLVRKLKLQNEDLVICHSDFFPNSIPSWILSKRNPNVKLAYFFHMLAPRPFRGYEGEFTGYHQIPRPTILHYRLNQWLYKRLTPQRAVILTVNSYYEKYLKKAYPKNRIKVLRHYGIGDIPINEKPAKEYDLIWIGRLHPQKGLRDLALIIKQVVAVKPELKVIVIGDGPEKIKRQFDEEIKALGVSKNVYMAGFVQGSEKYRYYFKSRVFIMTSYYESFGQVILEAMACDLPVVAYELPVYDVFENGIIKVPLLDSEAAASQIIKLLNNPVTYKARRKKSQLVVSKHSWALTGEDLLAEIGYNPAGHVEPNFINL